MSDVSDIRAKLAAAEVLLASLQDAIPKLAFAAGQGKPAAAAKLEAVNFRIDAVTKLVPRLLGALRGALQAIRQPEAPVEGTQP